MPSPRLSIIQSTPFSSIPPNNESDHLEDQIASDRLSLQQQSEDQRLMLTRGNNEHQKLVEPHNMDVLGLDPSQERFADANGQLSLLLTPESDRNLLETVYSHSILCLYNL